MKKIIALFLSIVMVMSMSVTAFATDTIISTEDGQNTASKNVTATYELTYNVTVAGSTNGTVTTNPTTAKEGDTVALTVSPDSGYELNTLTVTYGNNQSVEVSNNSFTMPAADVTVTATFKQTQQVVTNATITGVSISGVTTNGNGDYVITPTSVVTLTVSGTDFNELSDNNKVEVNGTEEALTVENGWTINTSSNTATKDYVGTTFSNGLTLRYTNDGGTVWTNVDVSISYEIPSSISVEIDWGNLSFTYDDTDGWSSDVVGGDQVTVTNNGDIEVGATVTYTPNSNYEGITGSFSPSSANLIADAEQVFTLTLDGTPTADLNDTTIGSVTVTITEPLVPIVTTQSDLNTALVAGGAVKLGADISASANTSLTLSANTVLDLNGYTLTKTSGNYPYLTIKNTITIKDSSISQRGAVVASGGDCAILVQGSNANLIIDGGTFTHSKTVIDLKYGIVTINGGMFTGNLTVASNGTLIIQGGTFSVNPSQYVDTTRYEVTENTPAGTWTVTAK